MFTKSEKFSLEREMPNVREEALLKEPKSESSRPDPCRHEAAPRA
jgi:hypothetical protein